MLRAALLLFLLPTLQDFAQDEKILARGDKLLEEAKAAYEEARDKASVAGFVDAGFKLEEARIKFIVLQEIGTAERQKTAVERLRTINQLAKLIHDGRVAISGDPGAAAPARPADPAPAPPPATPEDKPKPAAPAAEIAKRSPIPDPARQRDAEKLIKDLYKEQYAKKAPADRKALARQLLKETAGSKNDAAALWVLCREAQDVAAQVCDVRSTLDAIDLAAEYFDVDPIALKNAALAVAGKAAKSPEEHAALAEAALRLIGDLVAVDQFENADKAATAAAQWAKKSNDPGLAARAALRAKEVAEAKGLFVSMKKFLEVQAKTPDDPTANQEIGQFLCYVKGSWELGLRFLVKGSDPVLKLLAERELSLPTQTADHLALADAWYDLSDKDKSPLRKSQLLTHSRVWYEMALSGASGLTKSKIEKRLSEIPVAAAAMTETAGLDLLKLIDVQKDSVSGEWTRSGIALLSPDTSPARLQVPYLPPPEFTLTVVTERRAPGGALVVVLPAEGRQFFVSIDGWGATKSVIGLSSGAVPDGGDLCAKGKFLSDGATDTVVYSVRKTSLTVTLNGKRLFDCVPEYSKYSLPPDWKFPSPKTINLSTYDSSFRFLKVRLSPIGAAQGKPLR